MGGRPPENAGTYASRMMVANMTAMNGSIGRISSTIRICAMPLTMKLAEPSGGVTSEMPKTARLKMAKCRSLIPACWASGRKSGISTTSAGMPSSSAPRIQKITIRIVMKTK